MIVTADDQFDVLVELAASARQSGGCPWKRIRTDAATLCPARLGSSIQLIGSYNIRHVVVHLAAGENLVEPGLAGLVE